MKLPGGLNKVYFDGQLYILTSQQLGEIQAIVSEPDKNDPDAAKRAKFLESPAYQKLLEEEDRTGDHTFVNS